MFFHRALTGTFQSNNWGVHDMHGNVSEWCDDWYDATYYQWSDENDPEGPMTGTQRVVRGGSFFSPPNVTLPSRTPQWVGS